MKLQAKLQLNLQNINNVIRVSYNTYEKASFDQYLAVSIVSNTSLTSRAEKYIDDITGKGSLNAHFKKMLQKTKKFDDDTIKKVLDSSLYIIPILMYLFLIKDISMEILKNILKRICKKFY